MKIQKLNLTEKLIVSLFLTIIISGLGFQALDLLGFDVTNSPVTRFIIPLVLVLPCTFLVTSLLTTKKQSRESSFLTRSSVLAALTAENKIMADMAKANLVGEVRLDKIS